MTEQDLIEEENKEIVRSLMEDVFNEKNIEDADKYLAEDYTEYATGNGGIIPKGRKDRDRRSRRWRSAHDPPPKFDSPVLTDLVLGHNSLVHSVDHQYDTHKPMNSNRRTFLTAIGAMTIGGCTGNPPDSDLTDTHATTHRRDTTDDPDHDETTIGFAGDTMVGRTLNHIYGKEDVDPATIWNDFRPRLNSLDGVFCNLECCLSHRGKPFPDRPYHFRGDPEWAAPALRAGNIRFTNLANNHAMDFGAVALTDTIDVLDKVGIVNAGAGKTSVAAHAPATFSVGDLAVAVVSFSDAYQEYAATDNQAGIAWAKTNPENSTTQRVVRNAIEHAQSEDPDLLVVSVHWGDNWIEYPNDQLVAFGHWLIDQGVDLVHGHSAHVVQAIEQYGNGIILHDTGDLVDDFGTKDDLGNDKSYLFEVTLIDGEFEKIRLVPFYIDNGVFRASPDKAGWLRETMRERSNPFKTTYQRDGDGLVVQL